MNSITDVSLSLSHKLSDEKNICGGTITNHIILSGSRSTDHGSSGMLDLHLMEQDGSVLGELDLTSTTDKHLDGTLRSEVSLEDFLETLSGIDVDTKSLSLTNDIRVRVNELKR